VISSRRGFIPAGPRGQVARYSFPPCDLAPRAGCPWARRVEITAPALPLISEAVPGSGGARALSGSLLAVSRRRSRSMTTLTGKRLILRDFVASDESAVHDFARDETVTRFTVFGPNSEGDTRQFITEAVAQRATPDRSKYSLAATLANSGRLVGSVSIRITSPQHLRGELGFVFHPDVWSRGYATEATRLLLEFGREELRLRRVVATCHPDNVASARVLEKAGMQQEGRMRDHLRVRGSWRDSLLYAAINPAVL
jgi:ribosomal-protein-alanine N-acetyltransferase